jgi:hypothetical protein
MDLKCDIKMWTGFNWLRAGSVAGFCELVHKKEDSDQMNYYQLLKRGSV